MTATTATVRGTLGNLNLVSFAATTTQPSLGVALDVVAGLVSDIPRGVGELMPAAVGRLLEELSPDAALAPDEPPQRVGSQELRIAGIGECTGIVWWDPNSEHLMISARRAASRIEVRVLPRFEVPVLPVGSAAPFGSPGWLPLAWMRHGARVRQLLDLQQVPEADLETRRADLLGADLRVVTAGHLLGTARSRERRPALFVIAGPQRSLDDPGARFNLGALKAELLRHGDIDVSIVLVTAAPERGGGAIRRVRGRFADGDSAISGALRMLRRLRSGIPDAAATDAVGFIEALRGAPTRRESTPVSAPILCDRSFEQGHLSLRISWE